MLKIGTDGTLKQCERAALKIDAHFVSESFEFFFSVFEVEVENVES